MSAIGINAKKRDNSDLKIIVEYLRSAEDTIALSGGKFIL
jgi:hypothetical protein